MLIQFLTKTLQLVGDRITRFVAKNVEMEEAYVEAREILHEEEMIRQAEEEFRFEMELMALFLTNRPEERNRILEAADRESQCQHEERMFQLDASEREDQLQHEEFMRQLEAIGRAKQCKDEAAEREKQRKHDATEREKQRKHQAAEREKQRKHEVTEREKQRKHERELEL